MGQADSVNFYHQGPILKEKVFFDEAVIAKKGLAVCYDLARVAANQTPAQAATDAYGGRMARAKLPTTGNNRAFAGTILRTQAAKSGGQIIEIAKPGGLGWIRAARNCVLNATRLTGSVNAGEQGWFSHQGFEGRGTALALQTKSGIPERHTDGGATLGASGLVLTEAGATFQTDGVAAGDIAHITGGTGGVVTAGEYLIDSVDSETQITLAAAASSGAANCNFWIEQVNSPNLVLARLIDGAESGLVEEISPVTAAATASMVGGKTFIAGGYTIAGNSTFVLADAVIEGLKKAWNVLGTLGTSDYVVTVTSGLLMTGAALSTLSFDAAAEGAMLEWYEQEWRNITLHGAVAA